VSGSRLRARIEKVLDWASAAGLRHGPNPARWQGPLEHLLKRKPKAEHHTAVPWQELPEFMEKLRDRDSLSARALEFTIPTAARTGETIGARWDEIDLKAKVWTVPAERMKGGIEHQVPLSDRVVEILTSILRVRGSQRADLKHEKADKQVYAAQAAKTIFPLSNMAMLQMLRGIRCNGFTVHGFRSSFRDWAGERTHYPRDVIEFALAHKLVNEVEAAYRRETAVEKRRKLMQAWASFCAMPSTSATVIHLKMA
jgi:integrase